jgi:hypothetical protein
MESRRDVGDAKLGFTITLVRFRCSGPERLCGFLRGRVFHILWWDPSHLVPAVMKKHIAVPRHACLGVCDGTRLLLGSGQPRGIENPEPGRDEDPSDDPEADHYGDLLPSQVFEMMVDGSDSEDATPRARESLGQFEVAHLQ